MSDARERVLNGVDRIRNLPTMPENANRILMALSDERSDSHKISELLKRDVAMSANVLRVANSVYYSAAGRPIAGLELAVARIGLMEVHNIVTAAGVIQAFSAFSSRTNPREFWKHSVCVALVTDVLRRHTNHPALLSAEAGEALYFGGLLHDVGLLLLGHVFPALFDKLVQISNEREVPLSTVEQNVLMVDHGEIGARLCDKWRMPMEVCQAVRCHHFPDAAPLEARPFAELVHLADYICNHEQLGSVGVRDEAMFYERAWYDLGLQADDMDSIVQRVRIEAEKGLAIVA